MEVRKSQRRKCVLRLIIASIILFALSNIIIASRVTMHPLKIEPLKVNPNYVNVNKDIKIASATNPSGIRSIQCGSAIPELIARRLTPFEINKLRRELMMMEDSTCFRKYFQVFAEQFKSRIEKRHVMLHLPKAGGSSICRNMKESGSLNTVGHNCWKGDFCPVWSGCPSPGAVSCEMLDSWKYPDVVMNENWHRSFCNHHTYSILLREPVGRTMSHMNHFLEAVDHRKDHFLNSKIWRLSLIQSNYMTWSLSVGQQTDQERHHRYFCPSLNDLEVAKTNLLKMDYLLDLGHGDKKCQERTLKHLRTNGDLGYINKATSDYRSEFRREDVAALNALDVSLYQFANDLINLDCRFFELLDGGVIEE